MAEIIFKTDNPEQVMERVKNAIAPRCGCNIAHQNSAQLNYIRKLADTYLSGQIKYQLIHQR